MILLKIPQILLNNMIGLYMLLHSRFQKELSQIQTQLYLHLVKKRTFNIIIP